MRLPNAVKRLFQRKAIANPLVDQAEADLIEVRARAECAIARLRQVTWATFALQHNETEALQHNKQLMGS